MRLDITVTLKGTPYAIVVFLKKLAVRLKKDTGKDIIKIIEEVTVDSLKFNVLFKPLGGESGEGHILAAGAGIDVRGIIADRTTLFVNLPDDKLGVLRPTWMRIYNALESQKLIIHSYSGGINPLVLQANPKPNPHAPVEEWLEWRKREKEQFNRDWNLVQIADMCGRSHGRVKNVHASWKED